MHSRPVFARLLSSWSSRNRAVMQWYPDEMSPSPTMPGPV